MRADDDMTSDDDQPDDTIDQPTSDDTQDSAEPAAPVDAKGEVDVVVVANFNQYRRGERLRLGASVAKLWLDKNLVERA